MEDIIGGLIHRWERGGLRKGRNVREAWAAAVGNRAAGHTRPVAFKKGVLVVVTENSAWLYKMTMEKRDIAKKFNENYKGRTKLTGIRFRVGETEERT